MTIRYVCPVCAQGFDKPGFCTDDGATLASNADDPLLGQAVGSYRLAKLIGRGGMGEVYLGVHPGIGSRVAIKVLSHGAAENRNLVERFFAEARAVNVIHHEGIVNVLDLATLPDGRPYIMMEHLDGAPLSHFVQAGALPIGTMVRFLIEVLEALSAAHAAGITHRDLKPDNIFVTSLGRPKLLDFGIAKLRPELQSGSDGTRTGALLGTPHYMSPEQALGRHVDHRSDVYSAGVILFEATTGRRPFDAGSLFELLKLQIEAHPPRPSTLRSEMPFALEAVILRALDKNPDFRFQNAAEFARALDETLQLLPPASFSSLAAHSAGQRPQTPKTTPMSPMSPMYTGPTTPAVHPPTRDAFAATLGRERESSKAPWLALGAVGIALIAIAGVAALGIAFLFYQSSPGKPLIGTAPVLGSATAAPLETPEKPGLPLKPFTFDPAHFDAGAFFPHAEARARNHFGDAKLVLFSATGIKPDGTIDMTNDDGVATYLFRSEKASRGVAETGGSGGPRLGVCQASVSATEDGINDAQVPMGDCGMAIIGLPHCTLKQILTKAGAAKKTAIVTFNGFGPSGRMWVVIFDEEKSQHILPDDC